MTKKVFANILIIIFLVVLKFAKVMDVLTINGAIPAMPDLILIVTVFNGIFKGGMFAMIFGFAAGLSVDFFSYDLLGFYAFIYTFIGFLSPLPGTLFEMQSPLISLILLFIFLLIKGLIFLILGYIFLTLHDISHYFSSEFFVEVLLTLLVSIPIFLLFRKIYKKSAGFKDNV